MPDTLADGGRRNDDVQARMLRQTGRASTRWRAAAAEAGKDDATTYARVFRNRRRHPRHRSVYAGRSVREQSIRSSREHAWDVAVCRCFLGAVLAIALWPQVMRERDAAIGVVSRRSWPHSCTGACTPL
ncbi:Conserved hypothetical protein [Xanthomonas citri pv. fuscans]|nr:Conserved hypothetical protein [Xanthomonas citri pv. fuscans]